jgi:hypothetical protein
MRGILPPEDTDDVSDVDEARDSWLDLAGLACLLRAFLAEAVALASVRGGE